MIGRRAGARAPAPRSAASRARAGARADLGGERRERASARDRAEGLEREHVGRALPDREHLRVAQQLGQARVLDVARAAEGLEHLARARHRLARGE